MGRLQDLLDNASGEVQLGGSFGRWAQEVSAQRDGVKQMSREQLLSLLKAAGNEIQLGGPLGQWAIAVSDDPPQSSLNTLRGKINALSKDTGDFLQFSSAMYWIADGTDELAAQQAAAITVPFILSSPLDNDSILAPEILVTRDQFAILQAEPSIAIDPSNVNRIVVGMNSIISATWVGQFFQGYVPDDIETQYSNDGGATFCCVATSPSNIGTLLAGTTVRTNGAYEVASDPVLEFDTVGNVYASCVVLNVNSPPNAVSVSKGTFDGGGNLTWHSPTLIAPTTAPSTLNDKPWLAVDQGAVSPFKDRIYVSWTSFVFNPNTGAINNSPIFIAHSSDGGQTFSAPLQISGNQKFSQASAIAIAPDGTVYVFFRGSNNKTGPILSQFVVKSTDGGLTFSDPILISTTTLVAPLLNSSFRRNSFPAAAVAPNGDVYVTWVHDVPANGSTLSGTPGCESNVVGVPAVQQNCRATCVWTKSTDGGQTWQPLQRTFPQSMRTPEGYPVVQPIGGATLNAPPPREVEEIFPGIAISSTGKVYITAYRGTLVSPFQVCAVGFPAFNSSFCNSPNNFIHNTRYEYTCRNISDGVSQVLSSHPVNPTYYYFSPFIGDYTQLKTGPGDVLHAVWVDTNSKKPLAYFLGFVFDPSTTQLHNQEVVLEKLAAF